MADVRDNPDQSRFEVEGDTGIAVLEYRRRGDRLVLVHTGVPREMEGHGIASSLVRTAIDTARAEDLTLVPLCSYANRWIATHPEAVDGVRVERTDD